jgi:hypothetical protein
MFGQGKLLGATLVAVFALSHSALSAAIGFKPAVSYPAGTNPRAVVAADFNGDGKMDLAVANGGDPNVHDDGGVSILLGNGDGTYQTAKTFAAGKNPCPALPCGMTFGDFDSDGKMDVAVPNSTNAVSILFGNGDGTLQASVNVVAGNGPSMSVTSGDLNGDHELDLVVANSDSVSILLGNGDGTFQAQVDYPTAKISGLALADVNSDGKLDVVATIGTAGIVTFFGNGDGTLQSGVVCSCGAGLVNHALVAAHGPPAVADFNGDGKADLALGYNHFSPFKFNFDEVDVLAGNGDGTFGPPISTGFQTEAVAFVLATSADFDGDGKVDLAVVAVPGLGVSILQGNGDGTVQPPVRFEVGTLVGANTDAVVVADLDGTNSPDVVVTDGVNNNISVFLNTVSTDFSIAASKPSPNTVGPGQSATSTVSLSLLNASDNPVSLTCSVEPVQPGSPTCSLNPNSVTFDANGKASAQLTITAGTAAASFAQPSSRPPSQPWRFVWLPIAAFAVAGAGFRRNNSYPRRLLGFFVGYVLLAGLVFQSACGGGGSGRSSGPKGQSYTVTVTATSGSTQHSTTVTLTVQ